MWFLDLLPAQATPSRTAKEAPACAGLAPTSLPRRATAHERRDRRASSR
eukprot:CAMPEP_0173428286 /NCGR_PEP_ID=MMETSP1357-20121228/7259_1 /TAXON_ID=77926 /ORGANISM="Hemiselmis rufescens, Strain PCC563" /LENGTH=48 /DNA_ID= /DNA_START= /DNA_END= /DNA_ORIENTATION=